MTPMTHNERSSPDYALARDDRPRTVHWLHRPRCSQLARLGRILHRSNPAVFWGSDKVGTTARNSQLLCPPVVAVNSILDPRVTL
jgi:hypothetical protein